MIRKSILVLAMVLVLLLLGNAWANSTYYTITDLGALGGEWSYVSAINDSGQVVGQFYTTGWDEGHAFLWENGEMTDLATWYYNGQNYSRASGINNSGQVVGESCTNEQATSHAFLWDSTNGMRDLGTLGGTRSVAHGINDSGQVVGESANTTDSHAFLWDNGEMTDLDTLGGRQSKASGINNSGQVVGESSTTSGTYVKHAFLWENGEMTDLGTLGGDESYAYSINDAGQVVGGATTESGDYHTFLWENGEMTDLDNLSGRSSSGSSINNARQVVGSFNIRGYAENQSHAFFWDSTVGMYDLNYLLPVDSGWSHLISATDISNNGQIVGYGWTESGYRRAFLIALTSDTATWPSYTHPAAIPTPSAILLGFIGVGCVQYLRRRRVL